MSAMDTYPTNRNDAFQDKLKNLGRHRGDTGVVRGEGNEFAVTAVSGQMKVRIDTGTGAVDGIHGDLGAATIKDLSVGHASLGRIDRIVQCLHTDANPGPYSLEVEVLQGTPSANPQPPALRRTSTRIDALIAEVTVPSQAVAVLSSNIKMTRRWFPQTTDFANWSPSFAAVAGSSFSVDFQSIKLARWRYELGGIVDIRLQATVSLGGSNSPSSGIRFNLPVLGRNVGEPLQCYAFNNLFRSKVIPDPGTPTAFVYADIYPITLNRDEIDPFDGMAYFPSNGTAFDININGKYEAAG